MKRPIVRFFQDDAGDWAARLSCGHAQHTRHDPPFVERSWVLDEAGRASRIGQALDCLLCDRGEMPDGHAPYQRTKAFTNETVPAALTSNHTTKVGVWALIHVESGALDYTIDDARLPDECQRTERLEPGRVGTVIAEVEQRVDPHGDVSFYVEFWRAQSANEAAH